MCARFRRAGVWLGLVGILLALPASTTLAQSGVISYGSAVTGELTAESPAALYLFDGSSGDQMSAYVIGLSPDLHPTLSLLGPDQRQLPLNVGDLVGSDNARLAHLSYRLEASGRYTLIVASGNNSTGPFFLYVDGGPAPTGEVLAVGAPVVAVLSPDQSSVTYQFDVDPDAPTMLRISTDAADFAFTAHVFNSSGQLVAALAGTTLQDALLTLVPGSGTFTVTVSGMAPQAEGSVQIALGTGAAPQATPEPTTCQVTSTVNVNVRTGPGVNFPIIGGLYPGMPREVIGQNDAGSWYVIDFGGRQAWVAASVTTVAGPCLGLPVVASPPTPTPLPPTATPAAAPQIQFTVNGRANATIAPGECVTVRWNVQNVREVYYRGQGVTGQGSRQECPTASATYRLRVVRSDGNTVIRTVTITVVPSFGLSPDSDPRYGHVRLEANFRPDPYTVSAVSGGNVDVSYLGGACRGWTTRAPSFRLTWSGQTSRLRFYFLSGGNTTLVVRAPNGTWYCDDDGAGGNNPRVNIQNPQEGRYNVWVASRRSDTTHSGTLYITQLNLP